MTKNNHFFNAKQVELSKEFFKKEPEHRLEFEEMLEKENYSYKYKKISGYNYKFILVNIYKDFILLGSFVYEDFFDDFDIKTATYHLLEKFGEFMNILKNE